MYSIATQSGFPLLRLWITSATRLQRHSLILCLFTTSDTLHSSTACMARSIFQTLPLLQGWVCVLSRTKACTIDGLGWHCSLQDSRLAHVCTKGGRWQTDVWGFSLLWCWAHWSKQRALFFQVSCWQQRYSLGLQPPQPNSQRPFDSKQGYSLSIPAGHRYSLVQALYCTVLYCTDTVALTLQVFWHLGFRYFLDVVWIQTQNNSK